MLMVTVSPKKDCLNPHCCIIFIGFEQSIWKLVVIIKKQLTILHLSPKLMPQLQQFVSYVRQFPNAHTIIELIPSLLI